MFEPLDSGRFPFNLPQTLSRWRSNRDFIELDAPGGPVRATRDENGYPSIVARDRFDAAWAKGWLHARDRLGQVLTTRMAASGRMMEFIGDEPIARTVDRAVRLLGMPLGLHEHVRDLSDGATRLLRAYCDGFEAGRARRPFDRVLRLAGIDTRPLTIEDALLGYRMVCFFGLTSFQQIAEMIVAELVHDGADEDLLRLIMGSGADGIDIDAIRKMRVPPDLALLGTPLGGSNAFAVAKERSASGGALLMSEAHMEIGRFPPIFYVSHETYADGDYLQGVSIPGVPWLTMGRASKVGWTYTFGHADNVDVLIERCRDGKYQLGDDWVALRRRTELVKIRGGKEELWTFWDNDYGTIAAERAEGDLACVRWAGLHESTAEDINAIVRFPDCETVDELAEAHRSMETISLGAIFADRDGRIGKLHTGRVDSRPEGWTGAYPRPGWTHDHKPPEPLPESARPWIVDPASGALVAANEFVPGQEGQRWMNFPEPAYRWERLSELLADGDALKLEDLVEASYDEYDRMAARLAPVWGPLLDDRNFDEIVAWATSQSPAHSDEERQLLGLFHALHHEVVRAMLERTISSDSAVRMLDELGLILSFQHHLDGLLALEEPERLDAVGLTGLLKTAWPRAQRLVAGGEWPIPVHGQFKSIFTQGKLPPSLGFSTESFDFPGGPTSPFQTRVMAFEGEQVVGGPAYHYVVDMSDDGGWYHIPGGASELPWGPGYATGVDDWRFGRFTKLGNPRAEAPDLMR